MIALPYLRVSTERQKDSGLGAEMQLGKCRELIRLRSWQEGPHFTDMAVPGTREIIERPGLLALIEEYRRQPEGSAVVVVYDVKRLARSQRILWELLDERGAYRLILASATESFDTSTAIGRAMLGMLGVFAQLDWEQISERNRAMQAAVVARGGKLGRKHVLTPELAQKVRQMRESGEFSSLKAIADALNAAGTPSPAGGRWHETTVRRALAAKMAPESDSL